MENEIILHKLEEQRNTIMNLNMAVDQLKYELEKMSVFNAKVNQAYVNSEYQNNLLVQKINSLEEKNDNLSQQISNLLIDKEHNENKIKLLQQQLNQLSADFISQNQKTNDYLDHIDDSLDENDVIFKDLSEENQILLQGLIRMKQEFDVYVESSFKEKIFGAANLTVLSIELLQNNIIDNEHYLNQLNAIIKQIIDVYKEEGININFDDLLNDEKPNNINFPVGNIPVSTMNSMRKNAYKEKKAKQSSDDNIINLQDMLKKKNNSEVKIKTTTESHEFNDDNTLFNLFNNNLISEIHNDKKTNKKSKVSKKKKNDPDKD